VIGIGFGAASASGDNTTGQTTTKTVVVTSIVKQQATASTSAPATTTVSPAASFGDGQYAVGKDIQPGTYKTNGADGYYWARLKGSGGSLGDIIANGNPTGAARVTIKVSDKGFESQDCGTWIKVG